MKLQHMINDVKVKSFHSNVQYMYDVCIPYDTKEAHKLDEENSNDNVTEFQPQRALSNPNPNG